MIVISKNLLESYVSLIWLLNVILHGNLKVKIGYDFIDTHKYTSQFVNIVSN